MMKMAEYNVYYHEINGDRIKTFNVLREGWVIDKLIKESPKNMSREEFDKELSAECMNMFWCRAEYEVIISAWVGGDAEEKIDVYHQLKTNWNVFSEICWKLYIGE